MLKVTIDIILDVDSKAAAGTPDYYLNEVAAETLKVIKNDLPKGELGVAQSVTVSTTSVGVAA